MQIANAQRTFCAALVLTSAALLAACGGGGDDNEGTSINGSPSNNNNPSSISWTLSSHTYKNTSTYPPSIPPYSISTGYSTQSSTPANPNMMVVGMKSEDGTGKETDPFFHSSLQISFNASSGTGEYQINCHNLSSMPNTMCISITIGESPKYHSPNKYVGYKTTSGRVKVIKDSKGYYHFDTVGGLQVEKYTTYGGVIPGAPTTASFTLH
jgi:hypothetical protein